MSCHHDWDDPFYSHFFRQLTLSLNSLSKKEIDFEGLGPALCKFKETNDYIPACSKFVGEEEFDAKRHLSSSLQVKLASSDYDKLLDIMSSYCDLYYPNRTLDNLKHLESFYCLHILNHLYKYEDCLTKHTETLKIGQSEESMEDVDLMCYRDQGFTRPKVLILVPFRSSVFRIVYTLANLLTGKYSIRNIQKGKAPKHVLLNKKRFKKEFGPSDDKHLKKGLKPADYEATFDGNSDDHFRIGLSFKKACLNLYTEFHASDIIIASPLGLRSLINESNEVQNSLSDVFSSIEMLILDQCDIFLMQNWDHVQFVISQLHLQPIERQKIDFSRVRMQNLKGEAGSYMQTLVFSSISSPEIVSLFNTFKNFEGRIQFLRSYNENGTITQVVCPTENSLAHVFHSVDTSSTTLQSVTSDRFRYFSKQILPSITEDNRTLLFFQSYFDFVKLRNFLKKSDIKYIPLCEYTNQKKLTRGRYLLFYGRRKLMLYTERLHFFRRLRLRGIRQIVFYQVPKYPHFYSEISNMLNDKNSLNQDLSQLSITVLYSKRYDSVPLVEILGKERCRDLFKSDQQVVKFHTSTS